MWWEHWFDNMFSAKIESIAKRGMVKLINGRLCLEAVYPVRNNWLHVAGSTDCRTCKLWDEIFFKELGIIHSFCRYHCWKVVTRPRTVKELIQMHNLMYVVPFAYNFINPLPGKAGIDVRSYTNQPYGTFNYCTSLIEALRVKEIILHMITTYLPNDEIDGKHLQDTVIVKRACTEMEGQISGNNPWWNTPQTAEEWEIEKRLEEIFKADPDMAFQPAWLKDKTLQNWLDYANSIGDKSLVEFIGADIFSVQSRKYTAIDLRGGDLTPSESESAEEHLDKENQ